MISRKEFTTLWCGVWLSGMACGAVLSTVSPPNAAVAVPQPATQDYVSDEIFDGTSVVAQASDVLSRVSRQVSPSVVHIEAERQTANGARVEETGSGVIMTSEQWNGLFVVTNRHVVTGAALKDIKIQLASGEVINPVNSLLDDKSDIAVLPISSTGLRPAVWGNSDSLDIGHMVLAMGSPFGLSQSVTFGIISAKGRRQLKLGPDTELVNQDFLQTDAAINPGNSGGPLVNTRGEIIGINTAIASNSGGCEGIGFAIPAKLAAQVVEQLVRYGKVNRAYMGVKLDPAFSPESARRLRMDRLVGAHVLEVYRNTPAAQAGLQPDDIILVFNGVPVQDENHFINLVSLAPISSRVEIEVFRNGRRYPLGVVLANRDDLERRAVTASPSFPQRTQTVTVDGM